MTEAYSEIIRAHKLEILEACTHAFTALERNLEAKYTERQAALNTEKQSLSDKLQLLEEENARLKAENEALKKNERGEDGQEPPVPYWKYKNLIEKYHRAARKIEMLNDAHREVLRKTREQEKSIRQWQEYYDKRDPKRRKRLPQNAELEPSSPNLKTVAPAGLYGRVISSDAAYPSGGAKATPSSKPPTPRELSLPPLKTPSPTKAVNIYQIHKYPTERCNPSDITKTTPMSVSPTAREPEPASLRTPSPKKAKIDHEIYKGSVERPTSSQTTIDEGGMPDGGSQSGDAVLQISQESPVFVSARPVKRRRTQHATTSNFTVSRGTAAGSIERPIRVKQESSDCQPLHLQMPAQLAQTESLDLDDEVRARETPRKRQRLAKVLGSERNMSATPKVNGERIFAGQDGAPGAARTRSAKIKSGEELDVRGTSEPLTTEPIFQEDVRLDRVLQPVSVNTRLLRASTDKRAKSAKQRAQAIQLLSEDGEDQLPAQPEQADCGLLQLPSAVEDAPLTAFKAKPCDDLRLKSLLDECTPGKHALGDNLKTPSENKQSRLSVGVSSMRTTPRQAKATNIKFRDQAPGRYKPLRSRPLDRLTLDDFKVNPKYNQGLDYAFVEVVRNREQRHCLPGCTRPECCGGQFRKAVELGGIAPQHTGGLWASSQDEHDEEQRLLEEYLGSERARLGKLSEEERKELLLQARTKRYADKHAKHRHAYERRSTPPGFWRTGFPTTQEDEQDREAARVLERRKVEERYREAMRGGGSWLFRDEQG